MPFLSLLGSPAPWALLRLDNSAISAAHWSKLRQSPRLSALQEGRQIVASCILEKPFCSLLKTMHLKRVCSKQIAARGSPGPPPQLLLPQQPAPSLRAPSNIQMAADAAAKAAPGRRLPGQLCIWWSRELADAAYLEGSQRQCAGSHKTPACLILSPVKGVFHIDSNVC